ncbi:MAG: glutamine--fructose-6-phosphate transaminase (isomerizing), partial [Patescibacteria group bacterium]
MCGIIGYIGEQKAAPILIEGLKRLEYRGYDSAGLATVSPALAVVKVVGKVAGLEAYKNTAGTLGIGHTRWATHGEPSERNAHPHCSRTVAVVHNGIIENHEHLRRELVSQGFVFLSDTDTEVLLHLIVRAMGRGATAGLEAAVAHALKEVEGAYAIAVISVDYPDELVAACNSSPLVIGIGEKELYLASDELAFGGKVNAVAHLKDGEVVVLKRNGSYSFRGLPLSGVKARLEKPSVADEVNKGGHAHYMYKEILEQPQAMRNVLAGRLREGSPVTFGGFTSDIEGRLRDARRITLVGCGTSLFAAMTGKAFIERLSGVVCEAEQAAEFYYRDPAITSGDVVIGISQSGETADTLRAMTLAKERHALCLGITNRVGSALSKRVRAGIYLHAGP